MQQYKAKGFAQMLSELFKCARFISCKKEWKQGKLFSGGRDVAEIETLAKSASVATESRLQNRG